MAARVLLQESVAATRIVVRCKLANAHHEVVIADSLQDLAAHLSRAAFDVVLMEAGDTAADVALRMATLAAAGPEPGPPIILTAPPQRGDLTRAGLKAGADAVLPRPVDEQLLLATLRRAERRRADEEDPFLAAGLPPDFGFAEPAAEFEALPHVIIAADPRCRAGAAILARSLGRHLSARIGVCDAKGIDRALAAPVGHPDMPSPQAIVLPAAPEDGARMLQAVADLRSRRATSGAALIVSLAPAADGRRDAESLAAMQGLAAMALDLGADDVQLDGHEPEELALRLHALLARHRALTRQRRRVNAGLRLAARDPLTGLYNRRVALPRLAEMLDAARRGATPLAVMLIDLDRFKTVNDTHGHARGDRVLSEVADRLAAEAAPGDLLARIGGEEFLLAVPGADLAAAEARAARLSQALRDRAFCASETDPGIRVTGSIGLAVDDGGASAAASAADLLQRADRALLAAKSDGRDQVTVARTAA